MKYKKYLYLDGRGKLPPPMPRKTNYRKRKWEKLSNGINGVVFNGGNHSRTTPISGPPPPCVPQGISASSLYNNQLTSDGTVSHDGSVIMDCILNANDHVYSDIDHEVRPVGPGIDKQSTNIPQGPSDAKLFAGSKISEAESTILIISFVNRHGLTDAALGDLLSLVNFHLPENHAIAETVYMMEKQIGAAYGSVTKNWFCPQCSVLVESGPGSTLICGKCQGSVSGRDNYFISFDYKKLLQTTCQDPVVKESLEKAFKRRAEPWTGVWEDIIDGECYRNLKLGDKDITCCVSTDGVQAFESSSYAIWPIALSINELNFKIRKKYPILAGLWFGRKKPNFDLFFKVFVDSAKELRKSGIEVADGDISTNMKVYFPLFAADSVARCEVQEINGHSGSYSCNWCMIKGGLLIFLKGRWIFYKPRLHKGKVKRGVKRKWVFNPSSKAGLRNDAGFRDHIRELRDSTDFSTHYLGVKGASQLLNLPLFDMVLGFVFDYMHTFLGVVKAFLLLWTDPSNHGKLFYVGRHKELINERILKLKSPSECTRELRDLEQVHFWKMNEWRQWFHISVYVMKGILPHPFLNHFCKLVRGFSLLLKSSITEQDIKESSSLINEFCSVSSNLYGMQHCSFNMHILKHAPSCVRNWGPLWAYSMFQFEGFNGVLMKSFHGTRKIGMQISKTILRAQCIYSMGNSLIKDPLAKAYYRSLVSSKNYYATSVKAGNCTFLGPNTICSFDVTERNLLLGIGIHNLQGMSFKNCVINGRWYNPKSRNTRHRCNSVIKSNGELYLIYNLIYVKGEQGILFCNRIVTTPDKYYTARVVRQICKSLNILRSSEVDDAKFFAFFDEDLSALVEVVNNVEYE